MFNSKPWARLAGRKKLLSRSIVLKMAIIHRRTLTWTIGRLSIIFQHDEAPIAVLDPLATCKFATSSNSLDNTKKNVSRLENSSSA